MPGAGAFEVTRPWGPQLPARSRGSLPQEGGGGGDLGGQDRALGGPCSGRALSSAASFIPEDGHFTAWPQAEQGPGGEKPSGW